MDSNKNKAKGQILVLVAISLVVILAIVGFAIDVGIAYGVRAKLNAAVDAATIAALRAQSSGADPYAAAQNFFNANFPNKYLGTLSQPVPTTTITLVNGTWVCAVSATAPSPTYFARVFGIKKFDVHAEAESSRPTLDLALVIDTTASMSGVFSTVKTRAQQFIGYFNENDDRLAMVPFAGGVGFNSSGLLSNGVEINASSRGFSKTAINTAIQNLTVGGNTASEVGIRVARDQLRKVVTPSKLRVIVFFSDGAPNTFTGVFPLSSGTVSGNLFSETWNSGPPRTIWDANYTARTLSGSYPVTGIPAFGGGNIMGGKTVPQITVNGNRTLNKGTTPAVLKCDANKAARNLLENVANLARTEGIVVYSLGLGNLLDEQDITTDCSTWQEKGSTIMKRVANTKDSDTYNGSQPEGKYCLASNIDDLGPCFDAIAKDILLRLSK